MLKSFSKHVVYHTLKVEVVSRNKRERKWNIYDFISFRWVLSHVLPMKHALWWVNEVLQCVRWYYENTQNFVRFSFILSAALALPLPPMVPTAESFLQKKETWKCDLVLSWESNRKSGLFCLFSRQPYLMDLASCENMKESFLMGHGLVYPC